MRKGEGRYRMRKGRGRYRMRKEKEKEGTG